MKLVSAISITLVTLSSCTNPKDKMVLPDNRPATQIKFLNLLSSASDSINSSNNDENTKARVLTRLDSYVVDSLRQFKQWKFQVKEIKSITLQHVDSYAVTLSAPADVNSTEKPGNNVNFAFAVPKNTNQPDLQRIKNETSKLKAGDSIKLDGVIFMTDPTMQIITLKEYFNPSGDHKLKLIPLKIESF